MRKESQLQNQKETSRFPLHLIILILFFLYNIHSSRAQWNTVNVGVTEDLYSVDYFSTNDIWIGSLHRLIRTGNNGAYWPITRIDSVAPIPIVGMMEDIEVTSPTSAVSTGLYYLGNNEIIITTNSSGTSWSITHNINSGPLLRYLKSVDCEGNVCIAVGNTGRIARSTNSGATWTIVPSGVSKMLNDVKFIDPTTVFAAGENVYLKSIDAGLTWTATTLNGDFHMVTCPPNCIYMGEYYSDSLYKSVNNGQSFTSFRLPFTYRGVVHAISADTILASGLDGLYVSFNGGSAWEKYILNNFHEVNMIDFINSSDGIAVGDSGYVIRTGTFSSNPSLPIVSFSIPGGTSYCLNDTISFLNTTANLAGYTFNWKLDSVSFSTQYNAVTTISAPGTYTVTLTASNQYGSSSFSEQITIKGHELLPFVLVGSPATVCSGNSGVMVVPNSQVNVSYRLRDGFTNIGSAQTGNGNTLTFISSTAITSPTNFNVIATYTNMCYTDSLIKSVTINATIGGPKSACIPSPQNNLYGINNVSFNTIHFSTPPIAGYYNNYSCLANTNVVVGYSYPITITTSSNGYCAVWIDYDTSGTFSPASEFLFNGSTTNNTITRTISIPSNFYLFNIPIRMRVAFNTGTISSNEWCGVTFGNGEFEDYSITVMNAPVAPTSSFTYTISTACTTNVTFTNNTYNATNYFWDFGDGNTSIVFKPIHGYTSSGVYVVKLITSNSYGSDTLTQSVTIQNPSVPVPAVCDPVSYIPSCDRINISGVQITVPGGTGFSNVTQGNVFKGDFTCTKQVHLIVDSNYLMAYQLIKAGTTNCGGTSCMWVDWNNDGVFSDFVPERIINGNIGGCPTVWVSVHVPTTAVKNIPLRARILSDDNSIGNSCSSICGQFMEFSIIVHTVLPMAVNFTANSTTECAPATVTFNNTTLNAVTNLWDFGDGTTSTVASPTHTYNTPGIYSVKLVTCNGSGHCDSLTRFAYLNIIPTQFTRNPSICSGQSYIVSSHVYNHAGTYIDSLTSSNTCDSIITTNLSIRPSPVVFVYESSPCRGDSVVLSASPGLASLQWYRGHSPIPSATSSSLVVKQRGQYICIGIDSTQCSDLSNGVYVSFPCQVPYPGSGIARLSKDESEFYNDLLIYPNPGTGIFTIQSNEGRLDIFSYTGVHIFSKQLIAGNTQIDLSEYENGIYLVSFQNEETKILNRLVLMK